MGRCGRGPRAGPNGRGRGADKSSPPPILIETRVTDAVHHTGEVLNGSLIGESAFCPGGKTSGGSTGPTILTTFHCPGGRLQIRISPTQLSPVQSAVWEVVSGTGSFEGVRGGGTMVARFGSENPDQGRETFTGTVAR